jgi:DNA topoisomerase-6 subunit B
MATKKKKEDAVSMAARQREIAVSEFFSKNRHLLGFDNPTKALLTTVREAVDNSLDACEEAHILPELRVTLSEIKEGEYNITIEDNGPGIVKAQLGKIFGKLLYGSKFHRLKQSRGQQGIGISAAVMYGQMTTGRPSVIISKTGKGRAPNLVHLQIDTKANKPKLVKEETVEGDARWEEKVSGTSISITLEGAYKGGRHGIAAYLRQTALANPHARIIYTNPKGEIFDYPRVIEMLPLEPKEIKRHPHGVELGTLLDLLHDAKRQTLSGFMQTEFSRVSSATAQEICKTAGLNPKLQSTKASREDAEKLYKAIQSTKLMSPPTNCLSPIGEESIVKGLYWLFVEAQREGLSAADDEGDQVKRQAKLEREKEKAAKKAAKKAADEQAELFAEGDDTVVDGEPVAPEEKAAAAVSKIVMDDEGAVQDDNENFFVTAVTRPPSVYRGNPFQVEVGVFYGKGIASDELARVHRFANRVPLQYQASACAMTKAVMSAPWRNYEVQQSRGALPTGPLVIMVHIASAWVPYTSESKEAIADYDEIKKELRLAIMECGRRLQRFLRRRKREKDEEKKRQYIVKYLDPIGEALQDILGLSEKQKQETLVDLRAVLERDRENKPTVTNRKKKAAAAKAKAKAKKSA